jgi:pantoate--beta-alanine ligase
VEVIRTLEDLELAKRASEHANGLGGVLVPTMGALHPAHLALFRRARQIAKANRDPGGCVVSIFVNPTQFNEKDDFDRYPRPLEDDIAQCEAEGVSTVFAPEEHVVYPPDEPMPDPDMPPVAYEPKLEDVARPGHFPGVCQVLRRLFGLLGPTGAVFGDKDWQQLMTAQAIGRQMGVDVVGHETVREADGLAMSSRNVFVKGEDRIRARALSRALVAAGTQADPESAEAKMREVMREAGLIPDYAAVRDAETLTRQGPDVETYRAVIAARVGIVRLLDNAPWPGWTLPA